MSTGKVDTGAQRRRRRVSVASQLLL